MTVRQVALVMLATAAVLALVVAGPEQGAGQPTTTASTAPSTTPLSSVDAEATSSTATTSPASTTAVPATTGPTSTSTSTSTPTSTSTTAASSTTTTEVGETQTDADSSVDAESDESIQILWATELSGTDGGPPEVLLDIAVPPAIGPLPIRGQSFAVLDGGQLVDPLITPTGSAAEIVLLIDVSGSMQGSALAAAKEAAQSFLDAVPADARVGLISFGETVTTVQEPSIERVDLLAELDGLEATSAETRLWDALLVAADSVDGSDVGRASVVVLTDGDDTISTARPDQVITRFDVDRTALYAVAIESADANLTTIEEVVAGIGGQFLATSDVGQLDSLYTDIAGRLANRYQLRFASAGSGERTVAVTVAGNGLVASARTTIGQPVTAASPATEPPASGEEPALVLNLDAEQTLGPVSPPPVGALSSGALFWLGLGSMFAAMATVGVLLARPRTPVRLEAVAGADRLAGLNVRAGLAIDRLLVRHDRGRRLDRRLEAADLNLRPGEFLLALLLAVAATAVIVGALRGPVLATVAVVTIVIVALAVLSIRAGRRRGRFADQLTDTLGIMSSSLRAGQSLPRSIELVAGEAPSPTAEQFHRIAFEIRVGRDLTESIRDTAERMASPDLEWVAQAVDINRDLGGDLTEILDNVAATIRERRTVARQIDSLSAESRATGWLLLAMPVVLFLFSWWRTPDTIERFIADPTGQMLLAGSMIGMTVGHLWIRQLVKVKY